MRNNTNKVDYLVNKIQNSLNPNINLELNGSEFNKLIFKNNFPKYYC